MKFIDWFVVAILAAAVLPSVMTTLIGVDTSAWPTIAADVWDNLPVFLVIGALYIFLRKTGLKTGDD